MKSLPSLFFALCALGSVCTAQPGSETTEARRTGPRPLEVQGLLDTDPFTIAASATDTQLTVRVSLQRGWHMYGRDTGNGMPVELVLMEGSCYEAAGKLAAPMDAEGEINGKATITLPLRRTRPGGALRVRFSYMVCDALQCLPPAEVVLQTPAAPHKPLTVLLVTLDDAERSKRIKAFLDAQGFRLTVVHYKDVTKAGCEKYDLVIADSPNKDRETWDATTDARQKAIAFPEIDTPLIAVGFLGTELLEAHKIAPACGYI